MQSVCLSDFPFAIDGKKIEHFKAGDKRDFGQHTESLTKKGYLAPAEGVHVDAPEVEEMPAFVNAPTRFGKRHK